MKYGRRFDDTRAAGWPWLTVAWVAMFVASAWVNGALLWSLT